MGTAGTSDGTALNCTPGKPTSFGTEENGHVTAGGNMKNFLPPPGSLLEARKVHLCVPEGEGIRKGDESQFSLGYGMDSAIRHPLGLYCFPPAVQQFSHDVLCSSVSANRQEEYHPSWAGSKGPRAEGAPGTPLLRLPPAQLPSGSLT